MGEIKDRGDLMGRTPEDDPDIRTEHAGFLGLTACEFDRNTGDHLLTTRPFVYRCTPSEMWGVADHVVREPVPCPSFLGDRFKCASCPNRD